MCVLGYTGSQCELGIDECEDDFCGEHGDCIDGVHNFSCVCKVSVPCLVLCTGSSRNTA